MVGWPLSVAGPVLKIQEDGHQEEEGPWEEALQVEGGWGAQTLEAEVAFLLDQDLAQLVELEGRYYILPTAMKVIK